MSKLCIILAGLPARGKSTLALRLREGLASEGVNARIFNNGELRRSRLGGESSLPEFYHPDNKEGRFKREQLAMANARAAVLFLREEGQVAILDATNASRSRREQLESQITDVPLLYIECTNDDPALLAASVQRKVRSAEFAQLTQEQAIAGFYQRMGYYQDIYVPLGEEANFIRINTLSNRILEERLTHKIPYYIRIRDLLVSDWIREIFLARHGESEFNVAGKIGGDAPLTSKGLAQAKALATHFHNQHIPYIFTSERIRSKETAAPITALHPEAVVVALKELDEISAGVCEGMSYEQIRQQMPEVFSARAKDKYNYCYPGGEGYASMRKRVEQGFRKALFLAGGQPGIVMIGHQAVNRMILSLFLFRRTEDVPYIYIPQNQYYHIIATDRKKLFELVPFMPVANKP